MKATSLTAGSFILWVNLRVQAQPRHQVIFDTDFAYPPQDDSMALMLALKSPEIKILGITTVAGNRSVERATQVEPFQMTGAQVPLCPITGI